MRPKLEVKLSELDELMIEMGTLSEEMLKKSMTALLTRDVELAQKIIEKDARVDELELAIETKCINTIALQNPLAGDLRKISAILKMITDLERIGDYSADIAEVVVSIGDQPMFKPLEDLPRMAQIVQEMLRSTIDAYINSDVALAEATGKRDDEVDELYFKIYKELLAYIHEDKAYMDQVVALLFIGRYLERIADHTTNLCERIIFHVTGERKHF